MSFLSFIPIVGNIVDAVKSYVTKKQDVDLEKYKVDGVVSVERMKQDVEIVKARSELLAALKDDKGIQLARGLIMLSASVWISLIFWDSCFRDILPVGWTWRVLALPSNIEYIPYAVVAFLFALAWTKK